MIQAIVSITAALTAFSFLSTNSSAWFGVAESAIWMGLLPGVWLMSWIVLRD